MFVQSQNLHFPIPLKNITTSQLQLIERIHLCKGHNRQLLGEAKLSDRQTTIIISYLISTLFLNHLDQHQHFTDTQQGTKRQEEHFKTFVYLCKSEKRKFQVLEMAKRIFGMIQECLVRIRRQRSGEQSMQNDIMLSMYTDSEQSERQHEEASLLCKQKGLIFKRMYFTTAKKYMEYKLRRKEDIIWKKVYEFGCETDFTSERLNMISKKIDYLFIQHNDFQNLLDQVFTINLLELHLSRAHLEIRKLNKYYNFRQQIKKNQLIQRPKSIQNRKQAQRPQKSESKLNKEPLKQQNQKREHPAKIEKQKYREDQQEELKIQKLSSQQNKKHSTDDAVQQRLWNIRQFDRKFLQLYKTKKQALLSAKGGYASTSSVSIQNAQCYYLMNLQVISYFISFLIVEWAHNKYIENMEILNNYINILFTKTRISSLSLRRLRRIFLAFMKKYPPKIKGKELSYVYLDQVLTFFEKAVLWNEIFCKQSQSSSSVLIKSQSEILNNENNLNNRFVVFRQRYSKESNLKMTTFDQKILFEILTESSKHFTILANLAPSIEFYELSLGNFKLKQMQIEYRSPCSKFIADQYKYSINGFIVSSTPNQQDLHILNERQDELSKDQYDGNKKQDIEHYNQIIRSYGVLVHDICQLVSDGVIVYFPNPEILRECRAEWELRENIYERINKSKKIFEQDDWEHENIKNVNDFQKHCKLGRGAIYFLSAQSNFAKYQTFYNFYSRCIIFIGVPYHNSQIQIEYKIKYLKTKDNFKLEEALKNVTRCLSNCINNLDDSKLVIFADSDYNRNDIKKKWFSFIKEGKLSTVNVLDHIVQINKNLSVFREKREVEEEKRKREEEERKIQNQMDFVRRSSVSIYQN